MQNDYIGTSTGTDKGLNTTPNLNTYQNSVQSLNTKAYSSISFNSSSSSSSSTYDLADFNGTNGSNPYAQLVAGGNGVFYGTTLYGGAKGDGTVYKFNANTNTITDLADFNGTNGSNPFATLVAGGNGVFYGTTYYGGANNIGTVYEFNANTKTITDLADFNGTNGASPQAPLVAGGNGIFYGTTNSGGAKGDGDIYEFNANTNTITKLADFNGTNGAIPEAPLVAGGNGVFYGTTRGLGANDYGSIYEYNANTNTITKQADFNGTNGASPITPLIAGANGVFYGTAGGGANNKGTVYEFNTNTNTITKLADFNGTNGAGPNAQLVAGGNGVFYGTAYYGGANNQGTLYEFNANTNSITDLADFNGTNGSAPNAQLVAGANGVFYGTAYGGGANGDGTIQYTIVRSAN